MGANIDTGNRDKRSVDVEINIVPFIDLMSCLTAFLMVAGVWVNIARIDVAPQGKSRDATAVVTEVPTLSVLVTADKIYLGVTRVPAEDASTVIERRPGADPWTELDTALAHIKHDYLADTDQIEIAAESVDAHVVAYQDVVTAMDHAIKNGFVDVRLTDPNGLSRRPTL